MVLLLLPLLGLKPLLLAVARSRRWHARGLNIQEARRRGKFHAGLFRRLQRRRLGGELRERQDTGYPRSVSGSAAAKERRVDSGQLGVLGQDSVILAC